VVEEGGLREGRLSKMFRNEEASVGWLRMKEHRQICWSFHGRCGMMETWYAGYVVCLRCRMVQYFL